MRPAKEYHQSRLMLRELLKRPQDGKVDMPKEWTDKERDFLSVTCAHIVMLYHIAMQAGFDAETACKGVEALHASMRKIMYEICDEELPP